MLRAERQIFILAWDIDSRIRLPRLDSDDDAPEPLCEFIDYLARRNRKLRVGILLWDYTILYAGVREMFPTVAFEWATPRNVTLALDDELPIGASHHQKIVAIDDRVAFVGGMDLTNERWDTRDHAADDERRTTHDGRRYPPFHDAQLAVDGAAAAAVGDLCRWRWRMATGKRVKPPSTDTDPWPPAVEPVWRDVSVAVARTMPGTLRRGEEREIFSLYRDAIAAAETTIYIENQYLAAFPIAEALARRLAEDDGPEIVIVTQWAASAWIEEQVLGTLRRRFLARLHAADRPDRLRVLVPAVPGVGRNDYNLHAKVCVIDDRLVQIGSANLNNRSLGCDGECDLVVDCKSVSERDTAVGFRDGLVAEHLGIEVAAVQSAILQHGSLIAAIDSLRRREGRTLVDLEVPEVSQEIDAAEFDLMIELGDPEQPLAMSEGMREALCEITPEHGGLSWRRVKAGVLAFVGIGALLAIWSLTPIADLLDPEALGAWLRSMREAPWAGYAVVAGYVVGGLLFFPVTALVLATAITFGPVFGLLYALSGVLLSAAAGYGVGRFAGKQWLRRFFGERFRRMGRRFARRGIVGVAAVRIVPAAPFTLVNFAAGSLYVRFLDYMLGTVLGTVPGIAVLALTGERLEHLIRQPTALNVTLVILLILLWLGVGVALQWLINRRRSGEEQEQE